MNLASSSASTALKRKSPASDAAVLLGHLEPEQALLAGLEPDVPADRLVLEEVLGARLQAALDELAGGLAEGLVVGAVDVAGHDSPPLTKRLLSLRAVRHAVNHDEHGRVAQCRG